jgi:hypothetical protein
VRNPGRDDLHSDRLEPLDDLFGTDAGREVDVADWNAEQIVANRSADVAGQAVIGAQRFQQPIHAAAAAPFAGVELQLHCSLRERLTSIAAVAPQMFRPFQSMR